MKKIQLLIVCSLLFSVTMFGQTAATATWALTADQSVVVSGSVTGTAQTVSNMTIYEYSSGQYLTALGKWPAETGDSSGRYIQYAVTPASGNVLTVGSVSMYLYAKGGSYLRANVYYSKDVSFSSKTQIGSTVSLSTSAPSSANVTGSLSVPVYSGETFYIRVYPYDSYTSAQSGKYVITQSVIISGTTVPIALASSVTSLTGFVQSTVSTPSTVQSYTLSGTNLVDSAVVTPPSGYEVSSDGLTWIAYPNLLKFAESSGSIVEQPVTIQVRLNAASAGVYSGSVSNTSTGATTSSVAVSGVFYATEPTTASTVSFDSVGGNSFTVNFSGGSGSNHLVVVRADSAVNWIPTDGSAAIGVSNVFTSATDQGSGNKVVYDGTGNSAKISGLLTNVLYYVTVYDYNVGSGNSQNYLVSSVGIGNQTTSAIPTLVASSSSLAFGTVVIGTTSKEKSYTLSGKYLSPASGSVFVVAPSGYKVSSTSGSGFASSLTLSYSSATLDSTSIYVRFEPTSKTSYNSVLVDSGAGASAVKIAVSGAGGDSSLLYIKTYYVSPTGDDTNGDGSFEKPYKSVYKTALKLKSLDTLYLRGGVYSPDSLILYDKTLHHLTIMAYQNEKPTIRGGFYDNIGFYPSYSLIKGILSDSATHNGIHLMGHYDTLANCDFHHNGDAGLKLGAHYEFTYPRGNLIINCDAHDNYDTGENGGNADGFSPKWAVGSGNKFYGCRAWNNGDDGWDLWQADSSITIENCWAFANGIVPAHPESDGNGNGFKFGGKEVYVSHIAKNCVAFDNYSSGSGGKGFDQNNNTAGHTMYNCTAYNNEGYDFNFPTETTSGSNDIRNCIAYLSGKGTTVAKWTDIADGTVTYDSWVLSGTVSTSDFVTMDTVGARAARKADGSLPDFYFMHLLSTAWEVNAGTNVGLAYSGTAPDLGYYEYQAPTNVVNTTTQTPSVFRLNQNYPNPFNPSTMISFNVATRGVATLKVYDVMGREVAELFNRQAEPNTQYAVQFNANRLSSGVYFSVLQSGSQRVTTKMLLMK
jgi:hypothetical protein